VFYVLHVHVKLTMKILSYNSLAWKFTLLSSVNFAWFTVDDETTENRSLGRITKGIFHLLDGYNVFML